MAYSKNRRLAEIVSDTSGNLSVEGIVVPTQSNSDNDTSAASTAFVHAHVNALVDSAPGTLNTLNELAAALNDEANFGSTITTAVNARLPLAGGTLTGNLRGTSFSVGGGDGGEALNILDGGHTGHGASNTVSLASFAENVSGNSAGPWLGSMTNENTAVIGTRTASGNIAFQTYNGGSWGERMRIDSAGKVRIGATLGLNHLLNIQTASSSGLAQMEFRNTQAGTQIGMPANTNALSFFTADAERMRIDSSGKVGIGETGPAYPLHVDGTNVLSGGGLANLCLVDRTAYNGTLPGAGITFRGEYTSGGNTTNFATIQGIKENTSSGNYATALRFTTRANGGNLTERMRIDSSGNVGIGTISPDHKFHVDVGAPGSADKTLAAFSSQRTLRDIGFVWDDSASTLGIATLTNHALTFHTNGNSSERMRIDSSGDVLIGQTSQTGYTFAQKLVVGDGDNNDGITIQSGSTHQGNLAFNHSDGTTAHGRISYQHGTNYMQFFTNNTERMRIDSSGTVYIGPNGSIADPRITRHNNGYDYINSGNNRWLKVGASSGHTNVAFQDGSSGVTVFETAGTERMRIDSSGRVGIRNDGPGDFHAQANDLVIGNSSGHSGMTIRSSTTDAGNIFFADGTSGSQAYMGSIQYFHGADSGNNLSQRMSFGCNGGSEVLRLSRTTNIGYTSDGLFNSKARPSRWQATGAGALLLGYRDSGSGLYSAALGLEYDTVNGLSNIQYVDGFVFKETNTGTEHLRIETNGNIKNTNNSYGSISDSRLKTDIADAASQWNDVKALKVRKYKFGTASAGHDFLQIGVIAQELEASGMSGLVSESEPDEAQLKYAPELVGGQVKTVKYSVLYMKAIKALQEAMTRIETLESKVATLEGE